MRLGTAGEKAPSDASDGRECGPPMAATDSASPKDIPVPLKRGTGTG
ncbi:hypothetical protein SAMN04490356_8341 [Streptomyces melanosporofaciens]|uniref:Uncharacterized protein n=1 Tax=Streptomyces melanosporofaciens TaxID=67327 RepID=A0A1H5AHE4_STRMJ|nr:hypothetical protein SAMN04490356_8341 [Streptomyces melanosporofaciens]